MLSWLQISGLVWTSFFLLSRIGLFWEGYAISVEQYHHNARFRRNCANPAFREELGEYAFTCEQEGRRSLVSPGWSGIHYVFKNTYLCGASPCMEVWDNFVHSPVSIFALVVVCIFMYLCLRVYWHYTQHFQTSRILNGAQPRYDIEYGQHTLPKLYIKSKDM